MSRRKQKPSEPARTGRPAPSSQPGSGSPLDPLHAPGQTQTLHRPQANRTAFQGSIPAPGLPVQAVPRRNPADIQADFRPVETPAVTTAANATAPSAATQTTAILAADRTGLEYRLVELSTSVSAIRKPVQANGIALDYEQGCSSGRSGFNDSDDESDDNEFYDDERNDDEDTLDDRLELDESSPLVVGLRNRVAQLEHAVTHRDTLIQALTQRLEQTAEQLDRWQRCGREVAPSIAKGVSPIPAAAYPGSSRTIEHDPAADVDNEEFVGELRSVVQKFMAFEPADALSRIETRIDELRSLIVSGRGGLVRAAQTTTTGSTTTGSAATPPSHEAPEETGSFTSAMTAAVRAANAASTHAAGHATAVTPSAENSSSGTKPAAKPAPPKDEQSADKNWWEKQKAALFAEAGTPLDENPAHAVSDADDEPHPPSEDQSATESTAAHDRHGHDLQQHEPSQAAGHATANDGMSLVASDFGMTADQGQIDLSGLGLPPLPAPVDFENLNLDTAFAAIRERDECIWQLQRPLLHLKARGLVAEDITAADELPPVVKEFLHDLEQRWEARFRQTELDLSVERARLSRTQAALRQEQIEFNKQAARRSMRMRADMQAGDQSGERRSGLFGWFSSGE